MTSEQQNINDILSCADAIDVAEGLEAYRNYQRTMLSFSELYSISLPRVTGAFVALSPNNDYKGNLRSLATVLQAVKERRSFDTVTVSTYRACGARAMDFASGASDFLKVTKGPKTRSFYKNILEPEDLYPVTVDGHMVNVWRNRRLTMKQIAKDRFPYKEVAFDVRAVAFFHGLIPNQVQAIIWFAWKRINRIIFDPQLNLFANGNQWGSFVNAWEIEPFPLRSVEDAGV